MAIIYTFIIVSFDDEFNLYHSDLRHLIQILNIIFQNDTKFEYFGVSENLLFLPQNGYICIQYELKFFVLINYWLNLSLINVDHISLFVVFFCSVIKMNDQSYPFINTYNFSIHAQQKVYRKKIKNLIIQKQIKVIQCGRFLSLLYTCVY